MTIPQRTTESKRVCIGLESEGTEEYWGIDLNESLSM